MFGSAYQSIGAAVCCPASCPRRSGASSAWSGMNSVSSPSASMHRFTVRPMAVVRWMVPAGTLHAENGRRSTLPPSANSMRRQPSRTMKTSSVRTCRCQGYVLSALTAIRRQWSFTWNTCSLKLPPRRAARANRSMRPSGALGCCMQRLRYPNVRGVGASARCASPFTRKGPGVHRCQRSSVTCPVARRRLDAPVKPSMICLLSDRTPLCRAAPSTASGPRGRSSRAAGTGRGHRR